MNARRSANAVSAAAIDFALVGANRIVDRERRSDGDLLGERAIPLVEGVAATRPDERQRTDRFVPDAQRNHHDRADLERAQGGEMFARIGNVGERLVRQFGNDLRLARAQRRWTSVVPVARRRPARHQRSCDAVQRCVRMRDGYASRRRRRSVAVTQVENTPDAGMRQRKPRDGFERLLEPARPRGERARVHDEAARVAEEVRLFLVRPQALDQPRAKIGGTWACHGASESERGAGAAEPSCSIERGSGGWGNVPGSHTMCRFGVYSKILNTFGPGGRECACFRGASPLAAADVVALGMARE